MKRLTPRQARFISAFCRLRNGAAAAREAGYNPDRARTAASELRNDPRYAHVEAEIQRRLADQEAQDAIHHELMTNALVQRITFSPASLVDADGNWIPLHELEPEVAQHISSVQEAAYKHGDEADGAGQQGKSVSYKLTNQLEAIKILGKHSGYFADRASAGEAAPYRAAEEDLSGMFARVRRRTAEPIPGASDEGAVQGS